MANYFMEWVYYAIDAAAVIACGYLFYKGYKKGIINKAIWLGSFVVAYLAASWLCFDLADLVDHFIYNKNVTIAVAFVVIASIVIVGMNYAGKWLTKVVKLSVVGVVNSILGGLLNSLIFVVLLVGAIKLTIVIVPIVDNYITETIAVNELAKLEKWIMDSRIKDIIQVDLDKVKDIIK